MVTYQKGWFDIVGLGDDNPSKTFGYINEFSGLYFPNLFSVVKWLLLQNKTKAFENDVSISPEIMPFCFTFFCIIQTVVGNPLTFFNVLFYATKKNRNSDLCK